MGNLENHFGDDASLDIEDTKQILDFLVKNSAESSTMQSSLMFLKSIDNKDIIAMSQTNFWEKTHRNIPKEIFDLDEVMSKSNCKACHTDIEKGLIENENIKNINSFIF